ncbi:MAG: hypothetical protein L6R37_002530 [Teloschistes peruensis]|nr:MAG: hypothetical protein L6R37_002530 [Teloschistes peruensis]
MAHPDDYSNLEVGKPQLPSNLEVGKPRPSSDLEVGSKPYYEKEDYSTLQSNQPDLSSYDTHKEPTPWRPSSHSYTSSPAKLESAPAGSKQAHHTTYGVKRKTFWILLIISIVIVAVVIGGAIGGTVRRNHNTKSPAGSSGASPANAPATPPASKILNSTRLAGAGWNDTEQVVQQRIYLQGTDNNIWELAWNSSTNVWFTSNEALARAKAGSALAAAVSYQSLRTQLNLYYVNDAGELLQMNTSDHKTWDTNPVKTSNGSIAKPASDTSLAATWYKFTTCADCSENAFLTYQDADSGNFELVNASTSGEVRYTTIPGHPVSGSGSTFDLSWRSTTMANLRLGYQLQSRQIASAFWNGTIDKWNASESTKETSSYVSTTLGAPLAAFNFGRGAPVAIPDHLFVLSAGSNGVSVNWWDNSDRANARWRAHENPMAMRRVDAVSPIVANGVPGHVFAMQGGVVKEFKVVEDGVNVVRWSVVGDVTGS